MMRTDPVTGKKKQVFGMIQRLMGIISRQGKYINQLDSNYISEVVGQLEYSF